MVVIAALTCLLIASTIVFSMVQSALRIRRQLHAERDLRQTELLLTAGAERVAGLLSEDGEYTGDRWELPADVIVDRGTGRVTTEITRSKDGRALHVHIVAEYPLDRDFTIRRSQTFDISTSANQPEE